MMDAKNLKIILSNNLKNLLAKKRVTQTDMARDLEIPVTTVSNWMKAETYPRPDKIQLMADYFKVSRSDITEEYKETDEMTEINATTKNFSKNENDIAANLSAILEQMDHNDALMFDGEVLDETTKNLIIASIKSSYEMAKVKLEQKKDKS